MKKIISFICTLLVIFTLASCHTHKYNDYYSYDDTAHWYQASCSHSSYTKKYAKHTFTNDGNSCKYCHWCKKTAELNSYELLEGSSYIPYISASDMVVDGIDKNAKNLSSIIIPSYLDDKMVTAICNITFMPNLVDVFIPDTIKLLGYGAFASNATLSSLNIPSGVKYIGDYAFYNSSSLTNITIPSGLEYLGKYSFQNTGITSIEVPNSITELNDGVFYKCTNLKEVTLPNTLTKIGGLVFNGCSLLNEITLPSGVKIEKNTFSSNTTVNYDGTRESFIAVNGQLEDYSDLNIVFLK